MADLVGAILEVIKLAYRPAKKYLNYHRKFNEYVDDLKQAQVDLRDRKADIEQKLQEESPSGKRAKQEVKIWFKKVEEKIRHAQVVEEKVRKGKYLFRSCLGKLADEMAQEIKKIFDECNFPNVLVVNDPLPAKFELPTEKLAGSASVEEIYEYLMGDEVGKIGVWGMGGIGKTTIVKNVYNKLKQETKFSKLIWVTVSQDFDIRRLQKAIASQLKEDLSDDDDTTVRATKLLAMLRKQGRYVLILDDIWTSFPLNDVGIPEPEADGECKLILTTRDEGVVRWMDCKQVQVKCLKEHEALQLFLSEVGQDMVSNSKIESTMKLIVKECSGLPLAIVTVAGSMKGIYNPIWWEDALRELQGYTNNILGLGDKVFGCLKFSFVHLIQTLQPCFLYCALYPRDFEIPKAHIIEHWLEEGFIYHMGTRKEIHDYGHYFLQRLEECCLLERVRNGYHIKMHDVVRDMALRIIEESPHFFVKAGMQLTELLGEHQLTEDEEKVSFMSNYIKTLPSNLLPSKCMKLTSLFLSNNYLKEIPDSLFVRMPNLKILDLSRNHEIVSLPHSLCNLVNLTALLLSACSSLKIVPSIAKLVALRRLDLERTSITEIPQGLEALINLSYLNLGWTQHLRQIASGIFFKLVHLQHLELYPATLREEEIRELKKLEVLVGHFRDIHGLSMYVGNKKRLNEYLIVVNQNPSLGWILNSFKNKDFYSQVDNTKRIVFGGVGINFEDSFSILSDIRELVLRNCGEVRSADDIGGLKYATNLKKCSMIACSNLEYLFSSWSALQALEYIHLDTVENLKTLVANSGPPLPDSFSSLKKIYLLNVNGMKKLFSTTSILGDLSNLEELYLNHCYRIEEIIASEEEEQGAFNTNNPLQFMLPKLRILQLWDLPNLRSICSRHVVMVCDSLQEIRIIGCRVLERIPLYFSSLDNIHPSKCQKHIQPSIPPSLTKFEMDAEDKEWWERVEWEVHPNAKNVLHSIIMFT